MQRKVIRLAAPMLCVIAAALSADAKPLLRASTVTDQATVDALAATFSSLIGGA